MSAPINEKVSSKERQAIWVELQSLRRDTQAFRAEVYRLRTMGGLNKATNERLRSQQNELEHRGEVLIKQLSPQPGWRTEQTPVGDDSMEGSQLRLPASQTSLTTGNSLQLQA